MGRTNESASKANGDLDITPHLDTEIRQRAIRELNETDSPRQKKRTRKSNRKLGKIDSPHRKEITQISNRGRSNTYLPHDSDITELVNGEIYGGAAREYRGERKERKKHERDMNIIGLRHMVDNDLIEDDAEDDDLDWSISTDSESDFEVFGEIRGREEVNSVPTQANIASVGVIHYDSYSHGSHDRRDPLLPASHNGPEMTITPWSALTEDTQELRTDDTSLSDPSDMVIFANIADDNENESAERTLNQAAERLSLYQSSIDASVSDLSIVEVEVPLVHIIDNEDYVEEMKDCNRNISLSTDSESDSGDDEDTQEVLATLTQETSETSTAANSYVYVEPPCAPLVRVEPSLFEGLESHSAPVNSYSMMTSAVLLATTAPSPPPQDKPFSARLSEGRQTSDPNILAHSFERRIVYEPLVPPTPTPPPPLPLPAVKTQPEKPKSPPAKAYPSSSAMKSRHLITRPKEGSVRNRRKLPVLVLYAVTAESESEEKVVLPSPHNSFWDHQLHITYGNEPYTDFQTSPDEEPRIDQLEGSEKELQTKKHSVEDCLSLDPSAITCEERTFSAVAESEVPAVTKTAAAAAAAATVATVAASSSSPVEAVSGGDANLDEGPLVIINPTPDSMSVTTRGTITTRGTATKGMVRLPTIYVPASFDEMFASMGSPSPYKQSDSTDDLSELGSSIRSIDLMQTLDEASMQSPVQPPAPSLKSVSLLDPVVKLPGSPSPSPFPYIISSVTKPCMYDAMVQGSEPTPIKDALTDYYNDVTPSHGNDERDQSLVSGSESNSPCRSVSSHPLLDESVLLTPRMDITDIMGQGAGDRESEGHSQGKGTPPRTPERRGSRTAKKSISPKESRGIHLSYTGREIEDLRFSRNASKSSDKNSVDTDLKFDREMDRRALLDAEKRAKDDAQKVVKADMEKKVARDALRMHAEEMDRMSLKAAQKSKSVELEKQRVDKLRAEEKETKARRDAADEARRLYDEVEKKKNRDAELKETELKKATRRGSGNLITVIEAEQQELKRLNAEREATIKEDIAQRVAQEKAAKDSANADLKFNREMDRRALLDAEKRAKDDAQRVVKADMEKKVARDALRMHAEEMDRMSLKAAQKSKANQRDRFSSGGGALNTTIDSETERAKQGGIETSEGTSASSPRSDSDNTYDFSVSDNSQHAELQKRIANTKKANQEIQQRLNASRQALLAADAEKEALADQERTEFLQHEAKVEAEATAAATDATSKRASLMNDWISREEKKKTETRESDRLKSMGREAGTDADEETLKQQRVEEAKQRESFSKRKNAYQEACRLSADAKNHGLQDMDRRTSLDARDALRMHAEEMDRMSLKAAQKSKSVELEKQRVDEMKALGAEEEVKKVKAVESRIRYDGAESSRLAVLKRKEEDQGVEGGKVSTDKVNKLRDMILSRTSSEADIKAPGSVERRSPFSPMPGAQRKSVGDLAFSRESKIPSKIPVLVRREAKMGNSDSPTTISSNDSPQPYVPVLKAKTYADSVSRTLGARSLSCDDVWKQRPEDNLIQGTETDQKPLVEKGNVMDLLQEKRVTQSNERKMKEEIDKGILRAGEKRIKDENDRKSFLEREKKNQQEKRRLFLAEREQNVRDERDRHLKEDHERKIRLESDRKIRDENAKRIKAAYEQNLKDELEAKSSVKKERKQVEDSERKSVIRDVNTDDTDRRGSFKSSTRDGRDKEKGK